MDVVRYANSMFTKVARRVDSTCRGGVDGDNNPCSVARIGEGVDDGSVVLYTYGLNR